MVKIDINKRYQGSPSKAEMERRWNLAKNFMKERNLDYLVTQANDSILCQYVRWFMETRSTHYTYLLFDKDGEMTAISHGATGKNAIKFDVGLKNNIAIPVFNNMCYADGVAADKALEVINKKGCKKLGFIGLNLITAGFYTNLLKGIPNTETVDVTDDFDYLVAVKSEEELKMCQEACDMHDTVAYAVPSLLYAGRLEREFGADLYRLAMLMGADEFLNNILVSSSRIGDLLYPLHYQNKIIEEGDAINVLFEVPVMSGYYADLHRYWNIGTPASEMLEVVEASEKLKEYLASLCKPNVKSTDILVECNKWLEKNGFEPEIRLCGHGQGYGLVERPYFDGNDPMVLKENMYISLHPTVRSKAAFANPGNNYVVTPDGAKCMARHPNKLHII